jgi:uncharacterized protein DUF6080
MDLLPLVLLPTACCAFIWFVTSTWGDAIAARSLGGRWFQSDGWRVYDDMVVFGANHYRTSIRPLFSLISIPVITFITNGLSVRPIAAIWILNAFCMSVWAAGLYVLVRVIGASVLSAFLLAALAIVSASAMFWFVVPETYPLSTMFLMLLLLVAAIEVRRPVDNRIWMVAGSLVACTLGSNILAVFALSFFMKARKDALRISVVAAAMFLAALVAQRVILPHPAPVRLPKVSSEANFFLHPDRGGSDCIAAAELVSPIVAPSSTPIGVTEPSGRRLTVQCMHDDSGVGPYLVAAGLWVGLLLWGLATLFRHEGRRLRNFCFGVGGALAANCALHSVYGEETFLYALHFSPYLLILASGIFVGSHVWWGRGLTAALIALCATINFEQLRMALTTHDNGEVDERVVERLGTKLR